MNSSNQHLSEAMYPSLETSQASFEDCFCSSCWRMRRSQSSYSLPVRWVTQLCGQQRCSEVLHKLLCFFLNKCYFIKDFEMRMWHTANAWWSTCCELKVAVQQYEAYVCLFFCITTVPSHWFMPGIMCSQLHPNGLYFLLLSCWLLQKLWRNEYLCQSAWKHCMEKLLNYPKQVIFHSSSWNISIIE